MILILLYYICLNKEFLLNKPSIVVWPTQCVITNRKWLEHFIFLLCSYVMLAWIRNYYYFLHVFDVEFMCLPITNVLFLGGELLLGFMIFSLPTFGKFYIYTNFPPEYNVKCFIQSIDDYALKGLNFLCWAAINLLLKV